jgi:hypothetical protein
LLITQHTKSPLVHEESVGFLHGLVLAAWTPVKLASSYFFNADNTAASPAGFAVVHVNVVCVFWPRFCFGYTRTVIRFGGDDATYSHTDMQ